MAAMSNVRPTNPQVRSIRRFNRRFIAAMLVYMLLVPLSGMMIDRMDESILRYPIALLPVIPMLFGFWEFLVYLRAADELLRRIQFEAFGISLGTALIFTITWGFLESAELVPKFPTIMVSPLMIFA
jgi:hypothetical protein